MHTQIKRVIARLGRNDGKVMIDLTAGEHTPLGKLLYHMFYNMVMTDLLQPDSKGGYPHNGGQHSFWLRTTPGDAVAYIELLKETVMEKFNLNEEERQVASELSYISQEILALQRKM